MRYFDDEDEPVSIAEGIYRDMPDDIECGVACDRAAPLSISHENKELGGVTYMTFTYSDGSKLTVGDNGFLGCESPL